MKLKIEGKERPGQLASRAASPRVRELRAVIDHPPADLEMAVAGLSAADQRSLLVALVLEVAVLRQVREG